MAAMPFLFSDTLLFQGNLPRVLLVIIYKYASCLIPYMDSFLFLCGEWSSSASVFKDFPPPQKKKIKPNVFFLFAATVLKIVYFCYLY